MSHQTTGRIVGVLFLAAFVCYGAGSALAYRPIGPALMPWVSCSPFPAGSSKWRLA